MTHEQYLSQLILGFAGDASQPQPYYTGAHGDEPDAVLRWLAFTVAMYIQERCRFEPDDRGRVGIVFVDRVWERVGNNGQEDVDLVLAGLHSGQMGSHHVKVQAGQYQGDDYFLRISDWTARQVVDVQGTRIAQDGRVGIYAADRPHLWTMPARSGRGGPSSEWGTDLENLNMPQCCQNAMQDIRRVLEASQGLRDVLTVGPIFRFFSPTTRPGEYFKFIRKIVTGDWEELRRDAQRNCTPIQRNRVLTICELHILDHQSDPSLLRFWENMYKAFE